MDIRNIITYLFIIPGILFGVLLLVAGKSMPIWTLLAIGIVSGVIIFLIASIKAARLSGTAQTQQSATAQATTATVARKAGSAIWSLIKVIGALALTAGILYAAYWVGLSFYYGANYVEDFSGNQPHEFRGYKFSGNCEFTNNALFVNGVCEITRRTYTRFPWIHMEAIGSGSMDVWIEDANLPDFGYENFRSQRGPVTFGSTGINTGYYNNNGESANTDDDSVDTVYIIEDDIDLVEDTEDYDNTEEETDPVSTAVPAATYKSAGANIASPGTNSVKYLFDTREEGVFSVKIGNNEPLELSKNIKGVKNDRERIYHIKITADGAWIDNIGSR